MKIAFSDLHSVKSLKRKIINFYVQSQQRMDKKNLKKNYPLFLGDEIVVYAFKKDKKNPLDIAFDLGD